LFSSSFPSIILYRRPNGRQGTVKLPIPANSASNPGDKAPPGLLPVCLLLDALILVLLALPRQWLLPHGFAFHFQPV
jgi:hypothetical protein